jgi:DNA-binding beta-propeller fold protein YncE
MQKVRCNNLGFAAVVILAVLVATVRPALSLGLKKIDEIVPLGTDAGLLSPSGLWYDEFRGLLIVADTEAHQVLVLDRQGNVRKTHGRDGRLRLPLAVATDRGGALFIAERESEVLKVAAAYDSAVTEAYQVIDLSPFRQRRLVEPVALFVDRDNNLLVADRGNRQVLVIGPDRKLKLALPDVGEPADVWSATGKILVADPGFGGIRVYDAKGRWLRTLGTDPARFPAPLRARSLSVDSRERVWLVEETGGIRALDSLGNPLFSGASGTLFTPSDLAVDHQNNLYVLEQGAGRISVFQIGEF